MSDFFERYEKQLLDAGRRLELASTPSVGNARPSWRRFRPLTVSFAALLVAAPALAATQPWRPLFGEAERPSSATATAEPPPQQQLAQLGVLRRAQSPQDRDVAQSVALRYVGGASNGVRTDYIRQVTTSDGPIVLVPVHFYSPVPPGEPERLRQRFAKRDAICLYVPEAAASEGLAKSCFTTIEIADGRAVASLGRRTYGLVPDGIAQVELGFGAASATGAVGDNVFDISAPPEDEKPGAAAKAPTVIRWMTADGRTQRVIHP